MPWVVKRDMSRICDEIWSTMRTRERPQHPDRPAQEGSGRIALRRPATTRSAAPGRAADAVIMAVLAASQLIIAVDYNIVYVALPSIGRDLAFTPSSLQWVVSGYALTFGGLLLLGGRLADLLERKTLFVIALGLYAIASMAGGLAGSQLLLISARVLQGVGGAMLFPATLSIINTTFAEGAARNRAVAVWGAAGASGGALGALIGGLLTASLGWRWTFFVNVPVAAVVAVVAARSLPRVRPRRSSALTQKRARSWRFYDIPGSITATGGALLLVLGLVTGPQAGWTSVETVVSFVSAAVLLGVFVLVEMRTATPLMPLRMFRNRSLSTSAVLAALVAAGFGGQFYLSTTWLQDAHGATPIQAGLAFVPLALAIVLGTNIGSRLVSLLGVRAAVVIGMSAGLLGLTLVGVLSSTSADYATHVLPFIVLDGLGQGTTWTAMWIAASSGVRAQEQGIASGITSTSQQVGGAVGLAVLVAVTDGATGAQAAVLSAGLGRAFIVAGVLAGVGALAALIGLRGDAARPVPQGETPAEVEQDPAIARD
jgi:EmrB/QacA subfamily drug resistance transporter